MPALDKPLGPRDKSEVSRMVEGEPSISQSESGARDRRLTETCKDIRLWLGTPDPGAQADFYAIDPLKV